jgi:outer membrane protein assembly factor BamB
MMQRRTLSRLAVACALMVLAPELQGQAPATLKTIWHVAAAGWGTPAVDGSWAYFLTQHHEVVALHATTGEVRWRQGTGEPGPWTYGLKPVLTERTLIVPDYNLVGFDRQTGSLRWRFDPREGYGPGIYMGPVLNGVVITGSPSGRIYAVEGDSGALRWIALVANETSTVFAPASSDGMLFATYSNQTAPPTGGVVALDAATGRERWRADFPRPEDPFLPSNSSGGLAVVDELVIAPSGDGKIHAFARASGAIRWSIPRLTGKTEGIIPPSDRDYRAVTAWAGTLVAGSTTGYVLAYDIATQKERWRHAGGRDGSTAFAFVNDGINAYVPYISGMLVTLDLATGAERWRVGDWRDGFSWPPTVVGDQVFVSGSHTGFFAFLAR